MTVAPHEWQPGDLAACFGPGLVGRGISLVTASPLAPRRLRLGPSHVAILASMDCAPTWVESTTLSRHPCSLAGIVRSGVQAHRPEHRVAEYVQSGGRVDCYRLAPMFSFSSTESTMLSWILRTHFLSRLVDYDVGGALVSGTRVWQLLRSFPGADMNRVFCSELCAAVLMRLGRMPLDNPTRYNPARLLRRLVRMGIYSFAGEASAC